jgi:hypothetical protein
MGGLAKKTTTSRIKLPARAFGIRDENILGMTIFDRSSGSLG